jgi:hypothetical protein
VKGEKGEQRNPQFTSRGSRGWMISRSCPSTGNGPSGAGFYAWSPKEELHYWLWFGRALPMLTRNSVQ